MLKKNISYPLDFPFQAADRLQLESHSQHHTWVMTLRQYTWDNKMPHFTWLAKLPGKKHFLHQLHVVSSWNEGTVKVKASDDRLDLCWMFDRLIHTQLLHPLTAKHRANSINHCEESKTPTLKSIYAQLGLSCSTDVVTGLSVWRLDASALQKMNGLPAHTSTLWKSGYLNTDWREENRKKENMKTLLIKYVCKLKTYKSLFAT